MPWIAVTAVGFRDAPVAGGVWENSAKPERDHVQSLLLFKNDTLWQNSRLDHGQLTF